MHCRSLFAEPDSPAQRERATLPIGLFGVEEESFVEEPYLVKCLPSQEQHGADRKLTATRDSRQSNGICPGSERRRDWPKGALERPVRCDEPRSYSAQTWLLRIVKTLRYSISRCLIDLSVRIEKENVDRIAPK
jgi:hypothetical protein